MKEQEKKIIAYLFERHGVYIEYTAEIGCLIRYVQHLEYNKGYIDGIQYCSDKLEGREGENKLCQIYHK